MVVLLVATVVAAEGYVVILKNGARIPASERLEIEGDQALVTLVNGTMTSLPLEQVDLVATERYNQLGLGSALTLDGVGEMTPVPTATPTPSLGSLTRLKKISGPKPKGTPTPTPTPSIELRKNPYHDERVTKALRRIFDVKHLYLYKMSSGTRPGRLHIQATTDSQREVFHALRIIIEAYDLIHERNPKASPEAVEITLVTTVGKSAGTFRLSPQQVDRFLASGQRIEKFYRDNVIF